MLRGDAVDGIGGFAGEAPGAVGVGRARTAAEGTFGLVIKADVLGPTNRLAAIGIGAGLAEVGVLGHADKDEVRVTGTDLFAGPALGAFVDAGLGADALAHVFDAPAGLALVVFGTLVEEAAFAGEAVEGRCVREDVEEEKFFEGDVRGIRRHRQIGTGDVRSVADVVKGIGPGERVGGDDGAAAAAAEQDGGSDDKCQSVETHWGLRRWCVSVIPESEVSWQWRPPASGLLFLLLTTTAEAEATTRLEAGATETAEAEAEAQEVQGDRSTTLRSAHDDTPIKTVRLSWPHRLCLDGADGCGVMAVFARGDGDETCNGGAGCGGVYWLWWGVWI